MRIPRRIAQWLVCVFLALPLHGISFAMLLIRPSRYPEEAIWLKNNAGLDFKDHDGREQTGTRDGWGRIGRSWKRLPHVIKNLPHELFKSRPSKYAARLCGFLLIVQLVTVSALWSIAWWVWG